MLERGLSLSNRNGSADSSGILNEDNLKMSKHNTEKKLDVDYELENHPTGMDSEIYNNGEISVMESYKKNDLSVNNCWNRFTRGLRSLWATKQTEDFENDKNLYINTTIRELLIYIFFIGILVIITFGMRTGYMYWFTNLLTNLFINTQFTDSSGSFLTMSAESDFWKFLFGPLLNGLYWNTLTNDNNMSAEEQNFIYYENKLIGIPRIRQVRVGNNTCIVPIDVQRIISECYATYTIAHESKSPFGLQTFPEWTYTKQSILKSDEFQGAIATYGGGGYYKDLKTDLNSSFNDLLNLLKDNWIDRGTRAVIVDFVVYNTNINLFCIIKLVAEFPVVGGALSAYQFRTVKLIRYLTPKDYFILACEIIFFILILYYIIEEAIEITKHKKAYFLKMWNVLDICILLICIFCSAFNVYRTIVVNSLLDELIENNNKHVNLDSLSFWQAQFDNLTAFTIFIVMVKIFKYISFNKMMTQLMDTLNYCLKDLIGFLFMFLIIFFAFAQAGYLMFGSQLANYREFHICIFTLFRIILNDCNFQELQTTNSILGPLYFILYVVFVFFILFNMFLAILDDAYSDIKEELEGEQSEFEITEFLKEKTRKILEKLNLKREKIINMQHAIKRVDKNNDGKMDFNEWKEELRERGYADAEIEAVFAKYDSDGDRILDEKEQLKMIKELNDQKESIENELIEHKESADKLNISDLNIPKLSYAKYQCVCRRVDLLDNVIETLALKFDIVLKNFQIMNKAKEKSREAMEMVLNILTSMNEFNEDERKKLLKTMIEKELIDINQESVHY